MVLSNDVNIIYQIRWMLKQTELNIELQFTKTVNPNSEIPSLLLEALMHEMHFLASDYYRSKHFTAHPTRRPIALPPQQLCITYNHHPITVEICTFLQETERKAIQEEYFEQRFGLHPTTINTIDTYTLGRVIQQNPHRHCMFSKIIHLQLNTMAVNAKGGMGSYICPLYMLP